VASGIRLQLLVGPITVRPAPADVVDALQEAQVTQNAGQRSGFQLRFALAKDSSLDRMLANRSLDAPARVILIAYLGGMPTVLSDGVVTRHDVARSNESGQSTLSITGVDVSQMMDLIDLSGLPLPMPAEAQVYTLLAPFAAYGVIPLVVPSVLIFVPNPVDRWPSVQGTPFAYLSRLADDAGYTFYVEPGTRPGQNIGYWGPEIRTGRPQPALTVDSDAESNVESLSFSFDGIQRTVYVLTAFPKQVRIPIPLPVPDLTPLSPPLGRKLPIPLSFKRMNVERHGEDQSDDSTARLDVVEALARGLGRASQAAQVISGSGSLDVARYGRFLQCRRLVGVRGAGPAYDGEYIVKSVTTTLKRGEAKQRFTLARNAQVSTTGRVQP
jgi:hypothetical protein